VVGGTRIEVPLMLWRLLERHGMEIRRESLLVPPASKGGSRRGVCRWRWNTPLTGPLSWASEVGPRLLDWASRPRRRQSPLAWAHVDGAGPRVVVGGPAWAWSAYATGSRGAA
jgi:hypothetical protein